MSYGMKRQANISGKQGGGGGEREMKRKKERKKGRGVRAISFI